MLYVRCTDVSGAREWVRILGHAHSQRFTERPRPSEQEGRHVTMAIDSTLPNPPVAPCRLLTGAPPEC